MAKIKLMKKLEPIIAIMIAIAVGGLFLDGTTLANPLLGYIPAIVHTIVGWIVIVGVVIDSAGKLM